MASDSPDTQELPSALDPAVTETKLLTAAQQSTYESLIAMGFQESESKDAAKVFGQNLEGAAEFMALNASSSPVSRVPYSTPYPTTSRSALPTTYTSPAPIARNGWGPDSEPLFTISKKMEDSLKRVICRQGDSVGLVISGYLRQSATQHIPDVIQKEISQFFSMHFLKMRCRLHSKPQVTTKESQETPPSVHSEDKDVVDAPSTKTVESVESVNAEQTEHDEKEDVQSTKEDSPSDSTVIHLDDDMQFQYLAMYLERNGPFKYRYDEKQRTRSERHAVHIRMWVPFKCIKSIYPVDRSKRSGKCTMEEIMAIETDPDRMVEVPDDYMPSEMKLCFAESDSDEIEVEIEFFDQEQDRVDGVWPSQRIVSRDANDAVEDSEWIKKLKVGDIVDAMDEQDKWYQAFIRYIADVYEQDPEEKEEPVDGVNEEQDQSDKVVTPTEEDQSDKVVAQTEEKRDDVVAQTEEKRDEVVVQTDREIVDRTFYVHFIGWNIKWDERLSEKSGKIKRRGTNTKGPHRPRKQPRGRYGYSGYNYSSYAAATGTGGSATTD